MFVIIESCVEDYGGYCVFYVVGVVVVYVFVGDFGIEWIVCLCF